MLFCEGLLILLFIKTHFWTYSALVESYKHLMVPHLASAA